MACWLRLFFAAPSLHRHCTARSKFKLYFDKKASLISRIYSEMSWLRNVGQAGLGPGASGL
jgi:hypothetical protein